MKFFKRLMRFTALLLMIVGLFGLNITNPLLLRADEPLDPKDEALAKGAAWIVSQQNPDTGSWSESRDPGTTSLAVTALASYANYLGDDALDPEYEYSTNIRAGLNHIFSVAVRDEVNGYVHFGFSQIYPLGTALMAIASSEMPNAIVDVESSAVNGMTYKEVAEEIVNFIFEAQVKSGPGIGLWYYGYPTTYGDMSIAGWMTLGLGYAKEKFDIELPQELLDNLSAGIDIVIWDDDPDHELYGGAGYSSSDTIENSYRSWINIHKVGHLLSMMELVGDDVDDERVQASIGFIERHFNAPNSGAGGTSFEWPNLVNDYIDVGWRGGPGDPPSPYPSYIATVSVMKGLLGFGIETLSVDDNEVDWQAAFDEVIIDNQDVAGFWQNGGYPYSTSDQYRVYYTSWAMMTMLRSVATIAVTGVVMTCPTDDLITDVPLALDASVRPADATNQTVTWTSSDEEIATVEDGLVTPLKAGEVTIRVTTDDGGYYTECVLTVLEQLPVNSDRSLYGGWILLAGMVLLLMTYKKKSST